MPGLATLEDSQTLYDQINSARPSQMGGPAGFRPVPLNPLITPVGPHDLTTLAGHQSLWDQIQARRAASEAARLAAPQIRLWEGDAILRGELEGWRTVNYEFIENDTGTCALQLSLSHYLAKWIMDFRGRTKRNVIITIDKQGSRWSGFMDSYKVVRTKDFDMYLEVTFKHDYEQVKHILCWSNPFLLPEIQFPKLWVIFGPAKWCLLMTLFVNIFRLETSIWTLPDNPLDPSEWFPLSLNVSNWRNIVKPFPLLSDSSATTIVFSRFKTWHDVAKKDLQDAQLTVTCRRYLAGEDPHPFESLQGLLGLPIVENIFTAIPLRNGCLVWDIVDNSGWGTGTSFGGSLLTGLIHAIVNIQEDGVTEGINIFTGDPTFPGEYGNPFFMGTLPSAPWVVYDAASPYTGVTDSEFQYFEATDTSFVTGGHSMPGVNEAISAGVNMAGDFLSSILNNLLGAASAAPFAPTLNVPSLGGIMDALAKILYEDVFLAFMEIPTLRASPLGNAIQITGLDGAGTSLGDFHYYEGWGDGSDKAFTLSALMACRAKMWATRSRVTHKMNVSDAAPYLIGEPGYGHYWLGSRIGATVPEFPETDTIFVERVSKIGYRWEKDGPKGWQVTVGYREPEDPALKAMEKIREVNGALSSLGVL